MTRLSTIEGCPVNMEDVGRVRVSWTARGRIDGDGSGGNPYKDPCFQSATSLKVNGVSLNAEKVPFFVVPRSVILAVKGVVLGCQGFVTYKGKRKPFVVADEGPDDRLGEMSIFGAELFGIPSSPINGGDDDADIFYECFPDVPAEVDGIIYPLQPLFA